jgi:hypothetical protein
MCRNPFWNVAALKGLSQELYWLLMTYNIYLGLELTMYVIKSQIRLLRYTVVPLNSVADP